MSISKRALGVEGFKTLPSRPEPTLEQMLKWVPPFVGSRKLMSVTQDKRKFRVTYEDAWAIIFTILEIDEVADQEKFVHNNVMRILCTK